MQIGYARSMTPAAKKATYADLEAVPSNLIAEILGGVLCTQPRPASRHARADVYGDVPAEVPAEVELVMGPSVSKPPHSSASLWAMLRTNVPCRPE